MNKEEALEKYKEHLRDNVTYMGVGSMVLELLDNNKVANFAISSLAQEVYGLEEQNRKLKEALRESVQLLEDGCLMYDQHVPSGSSSFRSDAQWFIDTTKAVLKEIENV